MKNSVTGARGSELLAGLVLSVSLVVVPSAGVSRAAGPYAVGRSVAFGVTNVAINSYGVANLGVFQATSLTDSVWAFCFQAEKPHQANVPSYQFRGGPNQVASAQLDYLLWRYGNDAVMDRVLDPGVDTIAAAVQSLVWFYSGAQRKGGGPVWGDPSANFVPVTPAAPVPWANGLPPGDPIGITGTVAADAIEHEVWSLWNEAEQLSGPWTLVRTGVGDDRHVRLTGPGGNAIPGQALTWTDANTGAPLGLTATDANGETMAPGEQPAHGSASAPGVHRELSVQSNGVDSLAFQQLVTGSGTSLSVDIPVTKRLQPKMTSVATSPVNGAKLVAAGGSVSDAVAFAGLTPGTTYRLDALTFDRSAGAYVGGLVVSQFVAAAAIEQHSISLQVPPGSEGHDLVVVLRLSDLTDPLAKNPVSEASDPGDAAETVHVQRPALTSSAANQGNGTHTVEAGDVVDDVVSLTGLVPGVDYRLTGQLIDSATGQAVGDAGPLRFTARASDEQHAVSLLVPGGVDGLDLVVVLALDDLTDAGSVNPVASATALDDVNETVRARAPSVSTTASLAAPVPIGTPAPLTDDVTISGLGGGFRGDAVETATVSAILYGPFASPPGPGACGGGAPVAGSVTLAGVGDGPHTTPPIQVDVPGWYTWVATVTTSTGRTATHPCGQATETPQVQWVPPTMTSQAHGGSSGSQVLTARESIVDDVALSGLTAGDGYTLHGWLYDAARQSRVDGPIDDTFVADGPAATRQVRFVVPPGLAGDRLVVQLALDDTTQHGVPNPVATHDALDDVTETVTVRPSLTVTTNGQSDVQTMEGVAVPLVDQVTLTGLAGAFEATAAETATATATLYGPFPTRPSLDSCTTDHIAGQVTVSWAADGAVTTAPVSVNAAGWYTWVATVTSSVGRTATHECGLAEETAHVWVPAIHSVARAAQAGVAGVHAVAGDQLNVASAAEYVPGTHDAHDIVLWSGLRPGDYAASVAWQDATLDASGPVCTPIAGATATVTFHVDDGETSGLVDVGPVATARWHGAKVAFESVTPAAPGTGTAESGGPVAIEQDCRAVGQHINQSKATLMSVVTSSDPTGMVPPPGTRTTALAGARLGDQVHYGRLGPGDYVVRLEWAVRAGDGTCTPTGWSLSAPLSVTVGQPDGTVTVGPSPAPVTLSGTLVAFESITDRATGEAVASEADCGSSDQSVSVSTPAVTTQADSMVVAGDLAHDTGIVTGATAGDYRIRLDVWRYVPGSNGSGPTCTDAPTVTVTYPVTGDGLWVSPGFPVPAEEPAGVQYVNRATLLDAAGNVVARDVCGAAPETVTIGRPTRRWHWWGWSE